jgi:hypothetical protein
MYAAINSIGGVRGAFFWSSTERDFGQAWLQNFNFGTGGKSIYGKDTIAYVRAVRAF